MAPNNVIAHYDLGLALIRQKDDAGAIAEANAALAIDPNYYRAYYILAGAYEHQGKSDEAQAATKKFFAGQKLDPQHDKLEPPSTDDTSSANPDGG